MTAAIRLPVGALRAIRESREVKGVRFMNADGVKHQQFGGSRRDR
jgi:hypothetical protein